LANANETLLNATRIIAHHAKASVDLDDREFTILALRLKEMLKFQSIKLLQDAIEKYKNTFLYFTLYLSKNHRKVEFIPLRAGLSYFMHFYATVTLKQLMFQKYLRFGFSSSSTTSIDELEKYYQRCQTAFSKATKSADKSQINISRFRPLLFVQRVAKKRDKF
jgi:hypothetical protein